DKRHRWPTPSSLTTTGDYSPEVAHSSSRSSLFVAFFLSPLFLAFIPPSSWFSRSRRLTFLGVLAVRNGPIAVLLLVPAVSLWSSVLAACRPRWLPPCRTRFLPRRRPPFSESACSLLHCSGLQ
ncbi:hypothetical protein S245_044976, partial [Arachis hypogaea]